MKSEFLTEFDRRDINDKNFMLLAPLRYRSEILGGIIEAEKGFVSDGSSTPRVPFIWELYGDRSHREGVIHDRIYRAPKHIIKIYQDDGSFVEKKISKFTGDRIFKEAMNARKKPEYIQWGMYLGVVLGGASSYASGPERFKILNLDQER